MSSDTTAPTAIVNSTASNGSNGFSITIDEEAAVTIGFHNSIKYRGASLTSSVVGKEATFNIGAPGAVNNNQIYFKLTDINNNERYYIAEMHSGKWMIFELPFFQPDQP
ncbi:hypothetical protein JOC78_001363 [Bacillus ectoiniformans]|uniref:hypothetical protein n=1 Tax=Bacillus ectoiniformans TaxID=1494429 RepID=UPI001956E7CA|nr:hypothetical protein [Bacillus ectoiniformans]MBM7648421.1 hypothetical protein [Bacillus ectoiniformans]